MCIAVIPVIIFPISYRKVQEMKFKCRASAEWERIWYEFMVAVVIIEENMESADIAILGIGKQRLWFMCVGF